MFGMAHAMAGVAAGIAMAQAQREADAAFIRSLESLPEEQQLIAIRIHNEAREKARREATEERRHQELCSAIRSSRPSGLGLFW